jgi:hypothetical protein
MAAGRFLRNRRREVSSRCREAPRSPVHAGGPPANLFGSLPTNDAPLLLRTHRRPGPWKLRRLDWKNCRARHRTRRHWADCRNRIAGARTNGLHPSVDALASTSCPHFCRTDQSKTKDCHFQRLCHPSIAQLSCGVTSRTGPAVLGKETLENAKGLYRVSTESSILWKTVCWLLPGLDFIPNKFDRQGSRECGPF